MMPLKTTLALQKIHRLAWFELKFIANHVRRIWGMYFRTARRPRVNGFASTPSPLTLKKKNPFNLHVNIATIKRIALE